MLSHGFFLSKIVLGEATLIAEYIYLVGHSP